MELNNLLGKITHHQEEEPKKFLALTLTDENVQAAVWTVQEGRTEVVSTGSLIHWNSSEGIEETLSKLDQTITEASGSDINETIIGLPEEWVKDSIVKEKLDLIKKITTEFDLKALGYVTISDSIIKHMKIKEGSPASAIFIQVEDSLATVSVVQLGKILGKHSVGRSDDIGHDTEEALSRVKTSDNFPSRMIVYSETEDIEELRENLNSYDWKSKFNFLHLPKIETLPKGSIISAVAVAGGSEVAKSLGIEVDFETKISPESSDPTNQESFHSKLNTPDSPIESHIVEEELDDKTSEVDKPLEPADNNFGFLINEDIKTVNQNLPSQPITPDAPRSESVKSLKKFKLPTLPRLDFKKPILPKSKLMLPLALILLFVFFLYGAIYSLPKTTITVYLEPRSLDTEVDLTISPNVSSVNTDNATIPASVISTSVSGNDSIPTTGTKTVGDEATGAVTLYNRTSLDKSFPAGTIITSGDHDYSLQDDVTVEASSEGPDYTVIPGSADVSIIATAIGSEYNKDALVEFTIESFSPTSFVAKNESPITGGTSTEIKVVSQEDMDTLLDTLTSKLEADAADKLKTDNSVDTGLYIQRNLTEITKEEYSAAEEEETDTLSLDLELKLSGLKYNKKDIESLIADRTSASIPTGYTKTSLPIEVETSGEEELEGGEISLLARVKIKLLPQINETELKSALRGDTADELTTTLKELTGFTRAEALITPSWLPPRLKTVSRNPNNITLIFEPSN